MLYLIMPAYEIKSWNGGFADLEDVGTEGSAKFISGADIRKRRNTLSCNQALVEDAPVGMFTDLAMFQVPSVTGSLYFFCRDGKIIRRNSSGTYLLVYTDPDGAILGAAESSDDEGSIFLHWATATKLKVKKLQGTAYTPQEPWTDQNSVVPHNGGTYPKTDLTSATFHTMLWAVGNLYIANDTKIAIAGRDGGYSNEILRLFPEFSAKCLLERAKSLIVGCKNKAGQESAGYFGWDCGESLNYDIEKTLPTISINAMIDTEKPLLQVGTDGQIITCNFEDILPLKAFPGGGQCNPDAVCGHSGMALFGVAGNGAGNTGVYSFGRKVLGMPFVLNLEYPLTCDEIGSVKKMGSDVFVTYRLGSSYGVKKLSSTLKETAIFQSLDYRGPANIETDRPIWKGFKVETRPLPAGCSIRCYRRIDNTGDFIVGQLDDGAEVFNTEGGTSAVFNFGDEGDVCEFQVILTPNGNLTPEVKKAFLTVE